MDQNDLQNGAQSLLSLLGAQAQQGLGSSLLGTAQNIYGMNATSSCQNIGLMNTAHADSMGYVPYAVPDPPVTQYRGSRYATKGLGK